MSYSALLTIIQIQESVIFLPSRKRGNLFLFQFRTLKFIFLPWIPCFQLAHGSSKDVYIHHTQGSRDQFACIVCIITYGD